MEAAFAASLRGVVRGMRGAFTEGLVPGGTWTAVAHRKDDGAHAGGGKFDGRRRAGRRRPEEDQAFAEDRCAEQLFQFSSSGSCVGFTHVGTCHDLEFFLLE